MAPSGLYARLCHAFLVLLLILLYIRHFPPSNDGQQTVVVIQTTYPGFSTRNADELHRRVIFDYEFLYDVSTVFNAGGRMTGPSSSVQIAVVGCTAGVEQSNSPASETRARITTDATGVDRGQCGRI